MGLEPVTRYLRRHWVGATLATILFMALGLRLYGIDWDQGYGFHPDERSIYMQSDCMYMALIDDPVFQDCHNANNYPNIETGFPSPGVFFDADRSPLNPHWFPLGSVMIYLLVLIRFLIEPFTDLSAFDMRFVGRTLSALADVASIYMLFLLGRRLFNQRVGLLGAGLMAIAVINIQTSHFYRPETFIVLLLLASYWFMLNVLDHRRLRDWLFLGLFVGLAFATKVSVLPLLLPLLLVYGFHLFTTSGGKPRIPEAQTVYRIMGHALAGGALALAVFTVLNPYAFIDLPKFVGDTTGEASIARVAGKMPYTVQYIGSTPFVYELRQSTLWALGIPLGLAAWGGLLYALYRTVLRKPRWRGDLLLLAWVLPNLLLVGALFEVKFLRYIFPIMPFLILFGARGLLAMVQSAGTLSSRIKSTAPNLGLRPLERLQRHAHAAARVAVVLVVGATAFYTLGFMGVYSRPHPAVQASDWINENVDRGATIITDNHWDEGIPEVYRYNVRQIPIYEEETQAKMRQIAFDLSQAEYLVFYSNRTYGSIARVPERYPLSSNYYRALFDGELGYQLDRTFTSYPGLLGVAWRNDTFDRATIPEPALLRENRPATLTLNLGYADENVTNYDHPAVLLFKNTEGLTEAQIFSFLASPDEDAPTLSLMLNPDELKTQREGGTWSRIIKLGSWTNQVPVVAWFLLVELISLVSLPLAFFLFRPLPDRGIVLSKLLGILSVSYVAWLLASLHWLSFSRTSMLVGILVMAALSGLVVLKSWREIVAFLRQHWRLLALAEGLFLVAFLAFVAVRMANPDLWHSFRGGEKPMDVAYINAILRSTYMPPFDPWFAGGYINYYYWGLFIVANFIKALGIAPGVAYNLAVPMFFALTVTASYSIVYNVTEGLRRHQKVPEEEGAAPSWSLSTLGRWARTPVAAGLLAALFVTVIGNLDGAVQLVESGWGTVVRGETFESFNFWRSSRMLPNLADINPSALTFWLEDPPVFSSAAFCGSGLRLDGTCPDISPHITEFPFFSFLFGDLHAHIIVIPFSLLVLGFGLSFLVGLKTASRAWVMGTIPFFALALGALWAINTWDYPAYLLLMVVVLAVGAHLMVGRASHNRRVLTFIGVTVATTALSLLAFLPFHSGYDTFGQIIDQAKWQTPLVNYLGIHGLFIFLLVTFLIYINRRPLRSILMTLSPSSTDFRYTAHPGPFGKVKLQWETMVTLLVLVLIVYLGAAGYWTAAFLTILVGLAAMAVREEFARLDNGSGYLLFPVVIAGFAFLIGVGVEFILVGDDIGRMNTLFKFYMEGWVLMALASAVGLWYLARHGVFSLGPLPFPQGLKLAALTGLYILIILALAFWVGVRIDWLRIGVQGSRLETFQSYSIPSVALMTVALLSLGAYLGTRGADFMRRLFFPKALWIALLSILLFSSFIYTALGARDRLADRFDTQEVTLNGESFFTRAIHREQDTPFALAPDFLAIQWMRQNVEGSPVVMEAHTEQYHWGARFSIYTGLPTIIGWPNHQKQQRGGFPLVVGQRARDVAEFYSTIRSDRAMELLQKYDVNYVIIGDLERIYYHTDGLDKFQAMVARGSLAVAYDNGSTTVYKVESTEISRAWSGPQR